MRAKPVNLSRIPSIRAIATLGARGTQSLAHSFFWWLWCGFAAPQPPERIIWGGAQRAPGLPKPHLRRDFASALDFCFPTIHKKMQSTIGLSILHSTRIDMPHGVVNISHL